MLTSRKIVLNVFWKCCTYLGPFMNASEAEKVVAIFGFPQTTVFQPSETDGARLSPRRARRSEGTQLMSHGLHHRRHSTSFWSSKTQTRAQWFLINAHHNYDLYTLFGAAWGLGFGGGARMGGGVTNCVTATWSADRSRDIIIAIIGVVPAREIDTPTERGAEIVESCVVS